jgi:hypothetical protein
MAMQYSPKNAIQYGDGGCRDDRTGESLRRKVATSADLVQKYEGADAGTIGIAPEAGKAIDWRRSLP